jgi:predicted Zn-dependent protease
MGIATTARGLAAAALLGVAAAGCAVNPATGERQLALISERQEVQMGRQAATEIEQTMAMVEDPELQAYVARLGQQLAAASERPELPWSFAVVDDPTPNAFALPGGFIYVTRGMLNLMDSEAELVAVLGHEIAHVTARHSVQQISRAQLAQLGYGLGMILVPELRPLGDVAGLGLNLLMLKYSRDAEREADELGYGYARAQNYAPGEMADVFEALGRISDLEGQSPLPSWLSTHPAPRERVEAVQERLAGRISRDPGTIVGRTEFLTRIDGLAYGNNPRNGFFRDGAFYHPELEFRFDVPADWQTRNLAQVVLATSPEQDAAVQLTLTEATDPTAAMGRFLGQQGLQAGPPERLTINGLDATAATFQARTEQGSVAGQVAFIAHQGRVFQLVAYAAGERYQRYAGRFGDAIGSFAPLTDPEILNVQPPTVDIVRIDESMTLNEFQRRYPSVVPVAELAVINQLPGPEARLEAGMLVKRVLGDPALVSAGADPG